MLNRYVLAVTGNKCVDVGTLSKFRSGCKLWKKKKSSPEYIAWEPQHNSHVNHVKSSCAMKGTGAVAIFKQSVEKNQFNLF